MDVNNNASAGKLGIKLFAKEVADNFYAKMFFEFLQKLQPPPVVCIAIKNYVTIFQRMVGLGRVIRDIVQGNIKEVPWIQTLACEEADIDGRVVQDSSRVLQNTKIIVSKPARTD